MRGVFIIITIIAGLTPYCNYGQEELDLYLIKAADQNPGLQAEFSLYMSALEQVNTIGLPDPQIAFAYFIQPVETRLGPQQFKFSASQMFPWFGKLDAQRSVYAENAKVKYESFLQAKSQLFYTIRMTYYNYYFLNKAKRITQENIQILETLKSLALVKYESGKASIVDEMRVEMELNDLNDQLIDLEDNIDFMTVKLNRLINNKRDESILVPDSLEIKELPITKEDLIDSIISNNHQLLILEQKLISHEAQERLAQKQDGPMIMLGLDYVIIGKTNNPMTDPALDGKDAIIFPKVSLSIPIYRSKYNAMVEKVNLEIESTSASIEEKKNALIVLFEKGIKEYHEAKRRIELNNKQEKLAQTSLTILITEYSTNDKNFEEVLRMERKLLGYQLAKDKAVTDLNASTAFLDFLMGK